MMAHAPQRSWWPGSTRVLLLSGLFLALQLAQAAPPTGSTTDKSVGKSTAPGTTGATKAITSKAASNFKMLPAPDLSSDVGEMSRFINEKLAESWKANKIEPSAFIDDYEFIRRATLDIVGRGASRKDIDRFFAKSDPATGRTIMPEHRRSYYIEYLLKHEDYARHWANMWANWLLTRAGDFGRGKYHDQMTVWLEDQFAQNKPYDQIATKLITATGSNEENGAVNFFLAHLGEPIPAAKQKEEGRFEMVPLTSRITRVFLGTQVQCAQCHPHPFFNSLKQEAFWGVNAFLRQIVREGAPARRPQRNAPLPTLSLRDDPSVNTDASVFYEMRNGKVRMIAAEFLASGGKERGPKLDLKKSGLSRREELAKYLVEHDMFPKAMANRMWGLFFGRGFVNPIDDFNDNNTPSHPELLTELGDKFKHYSFDLKKMIRWITHSNAYHLSYVANQTNDKPEHETQFARMIMKSLSPEQLFESLMTATQADKATTPAEKKKLRDEWLAALITNFGDDEGNEVTFNGTIVQALLMMNGKHINDAITSPKGTVATVTVTKKVPTEIIKELYMMALNRPPRPAELKGVLSKFPLRPGHKDSEKAKYEDLLWALLNSNEFLLNH